jgi:hypothetical protein
MTQVQGPFPKRRWLIGLSATLALAVLTGIVFAAWVEQGPQILISLGSSALSWCF